MIPRPKGVRCEHGVNVKHGIALVALADKGDTDLVHTLILPRQSAHVKGRRDFNQSLSSSMSSVRCGIIMLSVTTTLRQLEQVFCFILEIAENRWWA